RNKRIGFYFRCEIRCGGDESLACATIRLKNAKQGANVVRRNKMVGGIRLHLVNNADAPIAVLDCDYVAPMIARPWRERNFIESCTVVGSGDDLFPFFRRNRERQFGIPCEHVNYRLPSRDDGDNQITVRSLIAALNRGLK